MGSRRNVYQGASSCYGRYEGVWVPGSGVTPETLPSFIALIVRDVFRGWGYDEEGCAKVKMDVGRGISRLQYLIALAKKHSGDVGKVFTDEALERLYKEYRMPPGVTKVRLAGYKDSLDKVAREVEELLGVRVEKEYHEGYSKGRAEKEAVAMRR